MLEGLYTDITLSGDATNFEAEVSLDDTHPLFEGHFPQRPVLPGVCQMHLVKALVERHTGRKLDCRTVREMKFLSPVTPPRDLRLRIVARLTTDNDSVAVQAIISAGEVQKTKIKATFV